MPGSNNNLQDGHPDEVDGTIKTSIRASLEVPQQKTLNVTLANISANTEPAVGPAFGVTTDNKFVFLPLNGVAVDAGSGVDWIEMGSGGASVVDNSTPTASPSYTTFNLISDQDVWRNAVKFTSTKDSAISGTVRSSTGYAIIMNYDMTYGSSGELTSGSAAVVGGGVSGLNISITSKAPPSGNAPRFYAIYPCDASGTVSGELTSITLNTNQITSISIPEFSLLTYLNLNNNQIPSIELSGLSSLEWFSLYNNQLTNIELSGLSSLEGIILDFNNLQTFDGTGLPGSVYNFSIDNNLLTSFTLGDLLLDDSGFHYGSLTLTNNQLDATALQQLYSDLHDKWDAFYSPSVDVAGNPGAGAGSGTDPSVATGKDWLVVGDVV